MEKQNGKEGKKSEPSPAGARSSPGSRCRHRGVVGGRNRRGRVDHAGDESARAGARPCTSRMRPEAGFSKMAAPPFIGRRSNRGGVQMRRKAADAAAAIPAISQRPGE